MPRKILQFLINGVEPVAGTEGSTTRRDSTIATQQSCLLDPFFIKASGSYAEVDSIGYYYTEVEYGGASIKSIMSLDHKDVRIVSVISYGETKVIKYQQGTSDLRCLRFKRYISTYNYTSDVPNIVDMPPSVPLNDSAKKLLTIMEETQWTM